MACCRSDGTTRRSRCSTRRLLSVVNPDLGEPAMAYAGKAQALGSLGKNSEAKGLLESLLEISRGKSAFGYESQALLELGKLEEGLGQGPPPTIRRRAAAAAQS